MMNDVCMYCGRPNATDSGYCAVCDSWRARFDAAIQRILVRRGDAADGNVFGHKYENSAYGMGLTFALRCIEEARDAPDTEGDDDDGDK